jgi:hypothetical protein
MWIPLLLMVDQGRIVGFASAAQEGLPARAPVAMTYGAWTGLCSNADECDAVNAAAGSLGPNAIGVHARLRLTRGSQGREVSFKLLDQAGAPTAVTSRLWFVRIRSQPHPRPQQGPPINLALTLRGNETLVLSHRATQRFLGEIRTKGAIEAEIVSSGPSASSSLPTSPASTVVGLFSVEGLVEINQEFTRKLVAQNNLPQIPILKPVRVTIPANQGPRPLSIQEESFSSLACGQSALRTPMTARTWPLSGRRVRLVAVTCLYERDRLVEIWGSNAGDGVLRPLELEGPPGLRDRVAPFMVNATFDPFASRLSVVQDGRSAPNNDAPDCGAAWSWLWTGEKFSLESVSIMPVCAGLKQADWLVAWQTRKPN